MAWYRKANDYCLDCLKDGFILKDDCASVAQRMANRKFQAVRIYKCEAGWWHVTHTYRNGPADYWYYPNNYVVEERY